MAVLKPFKGIRPTKEIAHKVASKPYDVLNSEEAYEIAKDNEFSLLHIIKSEIDFPKGTDAHSEPVYKKAFDNYHKFLNNKWLVQDKTECLYIYAQRMDGRTQYGIVGCASIDDYINEVIKKHELTRPDKEDDRMKHIKITNANIEPVFFTYPDNQEINDIVSDFVKNNKPEYDFVTDDDIGHIVWVIDNEKLVKRITDIFSTIPYTYVADGHHRTAAAARVGKEKRAASPLPDPNAEYNYFMAVHFPGNQLRIFDYNRLVKDLNGVSKEKFIKALENDFIIENKGTKEYRPEALHIFSLYIAGNWYKLTTKQGLYNDNDPIGVLDVTILSNLILDKLLNIKDLRTSNRIDFVGGIRGLGELKNRVDSGEMVAAFALYPVSMKQLFDIADTGNIMPPKTTWFEPKLRSGLIIHSLE